ncbi:MAG: DUF3567 domain-containing protein [Rubrivivax sp.]|nr:DUF3567 domain-containing protein [Rubrivivax sp.]
MQLLYNSDSYTVVQFELPPADAPPGRGGFEILDKRAGREIYLRGLLAETFERGVQALVRSEVDIEQLDEFIGGWTQMAQQPLALH